MEVFIHLYPLLGYIILPWQISVLLGSICQMYVPPFVVFKSLSTHVVVVVCPYLSRVIFLTMIELLKISLCVSACCILLNEIFSKGALFRWGCICMFFLHWKSLQVDGIVCVVVMWQWCKLGTEMVTKIANKFQTLLRTIYKYKLWKIWTSCLNLELCVRLSLPFLPSLYHLSSPPLSIFPLPFIFSPPPLPSFLLPLPFPLITQNGIKEMRTQSKNTCCNGTGTREKQNVL